MTSPSLACHVVFLTGPRAGNALTSNAARVTIGRASSCDIQFDPYTDLSVASQHAEVLYDEETDTFSVFDLGTRGGTYVNGMRINRNARLQHEDYIQFGKNGPEVIFRRGPAPPGEQPLPPKPPQTGELEFVSGADVGKIFPVLGDRVNRVGRRSDLEVALDPRGDMVISGNHCSVTFEEGSFILTDTSRNGTYINGAAVNGAAYLTDGDIVAFGEGGPRARFTVHALKRIYPNVSGDFAQLSSQEMQPQAAPAPPPVAAPPPEAPKPEPAASVRAAMQEPLQRPQQVNKPGAPGGALAATVRLALAPARYAWRGARMRPRIALGVLSLLVIAAVIAALVFGPHKPVAAGTENYGNEVGNAREMIVAAGQYSVRIPQNWASRENIGMLSIESADKAVTIDYIRDPRVTEASVQDLLASKGAAARQLPESKSAGIELSSFVGTAEGRSFFAVLHRPDNDVPLLALMESPIDLFQALSDHCISTLVINNVKMRKLAPAVAAATPEPALTAVPAPVPGSEPTPAATPESTPRLIAQELPPVATASTRTTPRAAQTPAPTPAPTPTPSPTPTAAPTPEATPTPAPAPTATPTATATPTPTPTPSPTPTPAAVHIASRGVDIDTDLPTGWTGKADEENKIVDLKSPSGIAVRLARDPSRLDPDRVFTGMREEGWELGKTGLKQPVNGQTYSYGMLKKGDRNLMLLLLDQPDDTTLVFYCTQNEPFTSSDWREVAGLAGQLAKSGR